MTPSQSNKLYAIIVAGGQGTRFHSDVPKQFLLLDSKPILMHTIEHFYAFNADIRIIVVLPKFQIDYWNQLCTKHHFSVPHTIVAGGSTRTESVMNGLNAIGDTGLVAIHDGVRPLVSPALIAQAFQQAAKTDSAIPTLPSTDTLRHISGKLLDRNSILLVQTPQVFNIEKLKQAYNQIPDKVFTDDASVYESAGYKLSYIEGERTNLKITTQFDLMLAEFLLKTNKTL